jgi:AcrR family transcriptional regulator
VARWEPNARERLERAALDLFARNGFAATTVPQIAEHAGLTTRTFYRHFADKREVLFGDEDVMVRRVEALVAEGIAGRTPLDFVEFALVRVAEEVFADRFDQLRAMRPVVEDDPGLQERELRKRLVMTSALAEALRRNGYDADEADVVANLATTALGLALQRWLATDPPGPLVDHVRTVMAAVRAVTRLPAPEA